MTEQSWDDVDLTTPPPGHEDPWAGTSLEDPSVLDAQPLEDVVQPADALDRLAQRMATAQPLEGDLLPPAGPVFLERGAGDQLPMLLTSDVALAVRDWTNPDEVGPFAGALRSGILDHVHERHAVLAAKRPAGRKLTEAVAAPELTWLAQTAGTLDAIGDAVKAGAKEARDLAGEVLVDVKGGDEVVRTGTVSAKVSDRHGGIKVTRTQSTEASVQLDEVVDVLAAYLTGRLPEGSDPVGIGMYAKGVRDGIAQLLTLMSAPKWKSTALQGLTQQLEGAGEDALAIRLAAANGRKLVGNPRTTVERTAVKP